MGQHSLLQVIEQGEFISSRNRFLNTWILPQILECPQIFGWYRLVRRQVYLLHDRWKMDLQQVSNQRAQRLMPSVRWKKNERHSQLCSRTQT